MTEPRHTETHIIVWQGITVAITYEPDYLNMLASHGAGSAHLQIHATRPDRAPLPITETGYRSFFGDPAAVADAGGPVAFVAAWLDQAATSPAWRDYVANSGQLSLF